MFCPVCGKEMNDGARFCNHCGAAADENGRPEEIRENTGEQVREQQAAGAGGGGPVKKGGLSLAAKILLPIAVICIAGAGIFAAVSLRAPKESTQETAAVSELEDEEDDKLAAGKSGEGEPSENNEKKTEEAVPAEETVDPTEETTVPAEEAAAAEVTAEPEPAAAAENTSGAESKKPTLADKAISALLRPSFFDNVSVTDTTGIEPSVPEYKVEPGLTNVDNLQYFYLPDEVESLLEQNGFAVFAANGREFFSIYESNRYNLLPNFVTVDSIMHVYHLYFSHLLKTTERNYLSDTIRDLSVAMLYRSEEQLEALRGSEWEQAALRNVGFFAVGAILMNTAVEVPEELQEAVSSEVEQINAAAGLADSYILGQPEDYSQYKPRGYYEGDEQLERYFRTMMWYGRMNFKQSEDDLDRSALLMTMALDDETLPMWESAYNVTSFFAGASDDSGYYEYKPIIDAVYGVDAAAAELIGNGTAWAEYHALTAEMPGPQINSVPGMDEGDGADKLNQNKGFRFMGQRFSLDAAIFQNLMYNRISEAEDGTQRLLPDALDIPAVLGSDEALELLKEKGEDKYPNYLEQVDSLRSGVKTASEDLWTASLYSRWLYTLTPLLSQKGEGWPTFMQTVAWEHKDLQTFLGSYTELKHDTVLYSKQAMAEMGGDAIEEKDDRGYVEPEPEVYARLSTLTEATVNGLKGYGILDPQDEENLGRIKELSDQLYAISVKELQNEALTDEEYDLIRTYGGQLEHFWMEAYRDESDNPTVFEFPAAIVTDVATDPNGRVLELGTGGVGTIYVVIPVDGRLRLASGSVYSFYQFEQPLSDRLTDSTWRQMQGLALNDSGSYQKPEKSPASWTKDFTFNPYES